MYMYEPVSPILSAKFRYETENYDNDVHIIFLFVTLNSRMTENSWRRRRKAWVSLR